MTILRPTNKLRRMLPPGGHAGGESQAALGDWYVNRVTHLRQPLLILISAKSLLPIVIPARDVRGLPGRLDQIVAERLRRLGVVESIVRHEAAAITPVVIGLTIDRSVLGVLTRFGQDIEFYLDSVEAPAIERAEAMLAETPCYASRSNDEVIFPVRRSADLLAAKWG